MSAIEHHLPIVKSLRLPDETATNALACKLALQPGLDHAFIALHGDLGAGKTTLVRFLLQALGVSGRIKSPTYAVVESYELQAMSIWHFDFYRFNDPQEWEDAGFRDIFASAGLKLAEWPDKAAGLLPVSDLDLHLEAQTASSDTAETARIVTLRANTPLGAAMMEGV